MHVQRHNRWQAATVTAQVSEQRLKHRARVATASTAGRAFGSGWRRKNKQTTVKQLKLAESSRLDQQTDVSLQLQQQAPQQQPGAKQQQQPGAKQQKSATVTDYAATYDTIADAIHEEFARKKIYGCCLPASVLFYEAVKAVNPAADPHFVLGYVVKMMPPGASKTCVRHVWVELDSRKYDIGRRVAAALVLKEHGTEGLSQHELVTQSVLERPPDAAYFGWNQGEGSIVPVELTEMQDAVMLMQIQCEPGRRLYWAAAPEDVLAIRDDILSRNWSKES